MIECVPTSAIVGRALRLVHEAQRRLRATELLTSPLRPLPQEYMLAVQEKLDAGVILERIAFGTKEQFAAFQKLGFVKGPQYLLRRADAKHFQRMLIVDDREMLFAVDIGGSQLFFYTDEAPLVSEFVHYFETMWNESSVQPTVEW